MKCLCSNFFMLVCFSQRSRKELREKGPPKILQDLKDVVLVEGSAAKLECRVSAFPDPFIVWYKDGKQLKDGPKYRYVFEDPDFVALVVRDGVLADLGKYTVTIKNPFGETSGSASILVEGVYILLALVDSCHCFTLQWGMNLSFVNLSHIVGSDFFSLTFWESDSGKTLHLRQYPKVLFSLTNYMVNRIFASCSHSPC